MIIKKWPQGNQTFIAPVVSSSSSSWQSEQCVHYIKKRKKEENRDKSALSRRTEHTQQMAKIAAITIDPSCSVCAFDRNIKVKHEVAASLPPGSDNSTVN